MNFKPTIIIDIDGTYYDGFKKDDKEIIKKVYKDNKIINLLNNIAWFFNSFDIFSNSFLVFKCRFFLYNIFTHKRYLDTLNEYEMLYRKLLLKNKQKKENLIYYLEKNYNIVFISSNPYACKYMREELLFYCIDTKSSKHRKKVIINLLKSNFVFCTVGNNYTDDIKIANVLGIKSYYIGKSIFAKCFKNCYCYKSFEEFVYSIKN